MSGPPPTGPIDLTAFAEGVAGAPAQGAPLLMATGGPGGPDVAIKGSFMVWDADHLAYWERAMGEQLAALRTDPRVVAFHRLPGAPPLRFYGEARLVEDGEVRDRVWERVAEEEKRHDPDRRGIAVLVRVDRVRRGRSTVQQR